MTRDTWTIRGTRLSSALAALTLVGGAARGSVAAEPLWRQIMPRPKVAADADADYTLTESNGPWLIMAASFNGEGAEDDAKKLVVELRQRYNLPAFYYAMTFKIGDERVGRGIDTYGAPIKRRYKLGSEVLEHAVLVGEFPTIEDPDAQALLERVKTIEPNALKGEAGERTSQSLASVREFYKTAKRMGKPMAAGPMSHAFISRNPLLPKEYFTPGFDPDVVKWNQGLDYSVLKCPKKYTIKVATFRGKSSLQKPTDAIEDTTGTRWAKADDPLVLAGKNAHELTVALRSRGWEAYEFHDRHESYVTVGSFDTMQEMQDGRLAPATREATIIVNTFGASTPNVGFEKPAYKELGMDDAEINKVEQSEQMIEQTFATQFSKTQGLGEMAQGFHPKQFVGLPFDIQPLPIVAPKESLGSAYARR